MPSGPCWDAGLVPGPSGPGPGSIRPENLASLSLRLLQESFPEEKLLSGHSTVMIDLLEPSLSTRTSGAQPG